MIDLHEQRMEPPRPRAILGRFGYALVVVSLVATAKGAASDPVEAGREAMAKRPSFPWYDANNDAVKPIEIPAPREPRLRTAAPVALEPLAWLAWGVLAVALVAMAGLLYWAWRHMPEAAPASPHDSVGRRLDHATDFDALPVRDLTDAEALRAAAEKARAEGRYREAMIYLYSYQLLVLDKSHFIRLARGKTNRQYLRELRPHEALASLMLRSVHLFESAFFGGRTPSAGEIESCWKRLDEFRALAARAPA